MNIRITALLIVLAIIGGSWAYFSGRESGPSVGLPPREFPAWTGFEPEDIQEVRITHLGESFTFVRVPGVDRDDWHFDGPAGPMVDFARWAGTTLLLSGPNTRRLFQPEDIEDYGAFGLRAPQTVLDVTVTGGATFGLLVGDKSPDGINHYVQFRDDGGTVCPGLCPQVYLIDSTWGDVMARMVTEPPYLPTPTPEPSEGVES